MRKSIAKALRKAIRNKLNQYFEMLMRDYKKKKTVQKEMLEVKIND